MEILFCDECGMRFTGETTPAPVAAQPGNEQRKLCEACRAKQSGSRPSHRQLQPATRARSERVLPGAQQAAGAHRSATHPAESARYRGGQASGGGAAIIGVAVVVALLTIGGWLFLKPGVSKSTAVKVEPAPAFKAPPAVTSNPLPSKTQGPIQPLTSPPAPVSPPATSGGPGRTSAQVADEAFEKLQHFEGLAPDDREGRIRRIEEFLAQHGQEIVAARARVMLNELKAPPAPPPPPAPVRTETPAAPVEPLPSVSTEGWVTVKGPFTFEDGQLNRWDGDLNSRVDVGEFEGRKCLRMRPSPQLHCRAFRGPPMDSAGLRVRFRYFAHDMEWVELLWSQGSHRPRKRVEPLVNEAWAEACFVGAELGGSSAPLGHIEIGGLGRSAGSFLLIDDVVWEKR